jgi:hypothetical protein
MPRRPRKQIIDLPLVGGVNSKTTPKGVRPPELLTLNNGRYLKEGRIDKSYGYQNLGQAIDSGTLNTPTALGAIRDELLMFSADKIYSYSEQDAKWYDKGQVSASTTSLNAITASPVDSEGVDVIVQDNIKVATWLEGTTYYYSVFDQLTGSTIVNRTTLATSAGSVYPRLASLSNYIYIFYNDSTNLKYVRIPTSNPSTTSSGTLYATLDSSGAFDVMGISSHLYVFFKITGVSTARISKVDEDLTVVATNTIASTDPSTYDTTAVYAFNSEDQNEDLVALGWVDGSNNVKTVIYNTSLVQEFSPETIETLANVDKLIIANDSTDGSSVGYFYSVSAADSKNYYTKKASVPVGGTAGSPAVLLRSVGIASKAIYHNDIGYFNVLHDSTLQATYFTVNTDGRIIAKFSAGVGGSHSTLRRPSNFTALDSTDYVWGAFKKGRVQSENATLFADRSPQFATLSLDTSKSFVNFPVNDDLIISGGVLQSYDGESTTEYGFHLYPEDVSTAKLTSTGSIPNGTYLIYALYEWIDARGVRHQSAPSVAETVTFSGSEDAVDVTVPALRLTEKSSDTAISSRAAVKVRIFITEAGGTVPYFAAEADNPDILTTDTVTIQLTSDPASGTSNEILYTSGGALENIAAPAHKYAFTHDNRIVALTPNEVRFSKQIVRNAGVGFNEDFAITIDPLGGEIVAGASMDQYMIIFKETATWAISGSGPNDLGQDDGFGEPQLISSDIGCKDVKSILQTPDGVICKSNKGIYLLDRGLALTYIGDKVEEFNSATVTSSDILKTSNEVRFVTDADKTLVYNYYFKRWATQDTPAALDATTWKTDQYVYLTSTKVLQEDSTTYLRDGSYVPTTIRTGWINLAGIQGYQRVYKLGILGTYHSNHTFSIKYFYDYSDIAKDTDTVTAATLVNTALYGDSATYGDDNFYGGSENDEVYQTRNHVPRQKSQAISFELQDALIGANIGQGFSLEGLSLEIGVKGGMFRTSQTRST